MDTTAITVHSAFDQIEDDFHRALDASLDPRGPEALLDLAASLDLPPRGDGRRCWLRARQPEHRAR
jgi:hypothetical protein